MCSGHKNGQNLMNSTKKIEDTHLSLFAWTEHYLLFAKKFIFNSLAKSHYYSGFVTLEKI